MEELQNKKDIIKNTINEIFYKMDVLEHICNFNHPIVNPLACNYTNYGTLTSNEYYEILLNSIPDRREYDWIGGCSSEDIRDYSKMGDLIPINFFITLRKDIDIIINNYYDMLLKELNIDLETINNVIKDNQELFDKYIKNKEKESVKKELPKDGYVYIIKIDNYYKIGISINPKNRLKSFTKLMKEPEIISLTFCNNYKQVEKELHEMFSDRNTNGEWFTLTDEELDKAIQYLKENEIKLSKNY